MKLNWRQFRALFCLVLFSFPLIILNHCWVLLQLLLFKLISNFNVVLLVCGFFLKIYIANAFTYIGHMYDREKMDTSNGTSRACHENFDQPLPITFYLISWTGNEIVKYACLLVHLDFSDLFDFLWIYFIKKFWFNHTLNRIILSWFSW